ncbi:Universal stress protein family protein [compost metagenome]
MTTPHTTLFFQESDIREYQKTLYEEAIAPALHMLAAADIRFEAKLLIGAAKDQICKEAAAQQARCIVMGSRGHSVFVGSVLGSVSQGVLYQADCPVMVVPATAQ